MISDITAMVSCFMGERVESEEECKTVCTFCRVDFEQWKGRLRTKLTPEDCKEAFVSACALASLSWLLVAWESEESFLQFRAGDISLSADGKSRKEAARHLEKQAREMMLPYISDPEFSFLGVRG